MSDTIRFKAATALNLYAVVTDKSGNAYNGTGFEALVTAHWYQAVGASYSLTMAEQASLGYYFLTFPAIARGAYQVDIFQRAGANPAASDTLLKTYAVDWTGTAFVTTPQNQWLETIDASGNISANVNVIVTGSNATNAPIPVTSDLTLTAAVDYSQQFQATGTVSTGWTKAYFSVKRSAASYQDSECLVRVRISSPTSGDGLQLLNGQAAVDATQASISVDATTPNTLFTVNLKAAGFTIPPTDSGSEYDWEFVIWVSGKKIQLGRGQMTVNRGVLRDTSGTL